MNMRDIIIAKRDKQSLTDEQIKLLLDEKGIDWNTYEDGKKYGRFIYKEIEHFHNDKLAQEYYQNVKDLSSMWYFLKLISTSNPPFPQKITKKASTLKGYRRKPLVPLSWISTMKKSFPIWISSPCGRNFFICARPMFCKVSLIYAI